MDTLYIAAIICFFAGSLGYVISKFWVLPIFKYRRIKKEVRVNIASYLDIINGNHDHMIENKDRNKIVKNIKNLSGFLNECFNTDLPEWYRLLLKKRGESPDNASKHLMILSSTRDYTHAINRVEKIRLLLDM